jgi:dihydrofolate reductase
MSSIIYSMMVSLDGFVARPDGALDWVRIDDELHSFANRQERKIGTMLYGRRMYELMAGYWPTADLNPSTPAVEVEYARIWRDKPKIVFSTTLDRVDWNATLMRDVVADEIVRLKARPDNDMSVGGRTLAATLMQLDVIDEYQLIVQPVILGHGLPFWSPVSTTLKIQLVETRRFRSGVMSLRYLRA